MAFQSLRVINEDRVQAGRGFPTHSHKDMEIVTYILEGALEHRDSMGTGSIIRPGDVQRMTAGTGVAHSERNPSQTETVHLLQIWILPKARGLKPEYEQKTFADEEKRGRLRLIVSEAGSDGSVRIHQDANLYASLLESEQEVMHQLAPRRHAWIQVTRGTVAVNGHNLNQGDGASISGESSLRIICQEPSEVLLFDLA